MRSTRLPLLLVAGLMTTACATSRVEAGCVAYFGSDFTVSEEDTADTVDGFAVLEARMEAACE